MKKRAAIFANGWNGENLYRYIQGLYSGTQEGTMDYFTFLCHATYTTPDIQRKSLSSIYELPDLSFFDAIIIYHPGLNFRESILGIVERARNSGLPVVSIGAKYDDFYFVGIDNYVGMKDLCSHIIEKHGVKTVRYIAGSRENDDSNIRLNAIRDSFAEYGLQLKDKDIFYSDWEPIRASEYVGRLCEGGEELPDAFICANDFLAESVSYTLNDYGIKTPEEVIVTGFDYTEEGTLFYPSIASVNQNYDEMGKLTAKIISDVLQGKEVPKDNLVRCEFCPGESCGCKNCNNEDERRKMYARQAPKKYSEADHMDGRRNLLSTTIVEAISFADLKSRLRKEFSEQSGCEGSTFFCMLDSRLSQIAESDVSSLPQYTYAEEMDIVVSKIKGKPGNHGRIATKELIPALEDDYDNHLYTFLPLYFQSFVCGYMVFTDKIEWFLSNAFYKFEQSCAASILLYRRNVQVTELNEKLSELMEQDSLTKVKNRTAYERYLKVFHKKFDSGEIREFAVAYFDINNLKLINDSLGHDKGDLYIQNSCKFICNHFKNSPVFRIGGDEFVVILTGVDFQNRNNIMLRICEEMKSDPDGQELSVERVSVAFGMADYHYETDAELKSVFQRADEQMYKTKGIMKKGNIR